MKVKRWLVLPFLGSSSEPEKQKVTGQQKEPQNVDPVDLESPPTTTAKDFAQKTEEDIVQDYNSPIHMWVSFEVCVAFINTELMAPVCRLLQRYSHSLPAPLVLWHQCLIFAPSLFLGDSL